MFFPLIGFLFNFILINVTVLHNDLISLVRNVHVLDDFFRLLLEDFHFGRFFRDDCDVLFAFEIFRTPWTLDHFAGFFVAVIARRLKRALLFVVLFTFDRLATVRKL